VNKENLLVELEVKMNKSISSLDHDLAGLRTSRASPNLLDKVVVEAYGDKMPLSQISSISIPEARLINIQVWDKGLVKSVEKAIANSNLGLTPSSEGQIVRINLPALTEERRAELAKLSHKYGENAKIALRNLRREGTDSIKKMQKDSDISEDEMHELNAKLQKQTDKFINIIDEKIAQKEKDITTV
jgi:ribosome recycling factor